MRADPQRRGSIGSTSVDEYYRDEAVRARMLEYCGATDDSPATTAFVVALDPDARPFPHWDASPHRPVSELPAGWRLGRDLSRSLWDTEHLVFLFDLDYQNIDYPAEPFLHPTEVFFKIEPTYRATAGVFNSLDLHTRVIATGRGYQFTGQVPLADPVVDALAALTPDTPVWYERVEAHRPAGVTSALSERQARAWAGLSLVLEYAANLVLAHASEASPIPVVLNGTAVGAGRVGRECVSIDVSHAGDPLDVRHMRIAFSAYQWHRLRPDIFGTEAATRVPPLVSIPRGHQSLVTFLTHGRELEDGRRLAGQTRACLPDVTPGIARLLERYAQSPLAAFHQRFERARRASRRRVVHVDPWSLPPCEAVVLQQPNDLLLKPEYVQHLVRGLMARGWDPADIASLIQLKYEEDHGWGDRWSWMHPETRAEFDVRVFAGLLETGADSLVDFNCVSAQEKRVCPRTPCTYDLRRDRDRLRSTQTA